MNLTEKTIKAHIKHFNLTIKNSFLYKYKVAIYTEDLVNREKLLSFLEGLSCVLDNPELWRLKND